MIGPFTYQALPAPAGAWRSRTGRDLRVLPRSVVYDAELTVSLPAGLSATLVLPHARTHAVVKAISPMAEELRDG